ncbi:4-hydroxyphenylacetate 3-monooxygenase, oxygenase component [Paenibacillus tarimensis]
MNGRRVEGAISVHPSFRGIISTQASLYNLQCREDKQDRMTYPSPSTGQRAGISFMQPKSAADLVKRRTAFYEWANIHQGFMGRSPDYMNTFLMIMAAASELFAEGDPRFGDNVKNYYGYCRENDVTLTHTFLRPQYDRSSQYDPSEGGSAARITGRSSEGLIVSGSFIIATQGGITDEIVVFPTPCPQMDREDNPFAFAFAVPANTNGLKFICRDAYDRGEESGDNPLASRFDEPDALVVMEEVVVPWNRVFVDGNAALMNRLFAESNFYTHAGHQIVMRQIVKAEFCLGLTQLLVDTLNIDEYLHVQDKLSELIVALETMKALLAASEAEAEPDRWGTMMPDPAFISTAVTYFPRVFPRITEIVQLIGASGLIMIPTRKDFESTLSHDLERHLCTSTVTAERRSSYFRLAWDMTMSAFGTRQTLYERFFFGDPARTGARLYCSYDSSKCVDRVVDFMNRINTRISS